MIKVGYLVNHQRWMEGERGTFFDYILASNGLFIEARGKLLSARIPVAPAEVRGLAPVAPEVILRYGRIPQRLFDLAVSVMLADPGRERYLAITWEDGYHVRFPTQDGTGVAVQYSAVANVLLDLHSHGGMQAFFSRQDNEDEQGLRLYAVIGRMNEIPEVKMRCGVYGYFHPIAWGDLFEGSLMVVTEDEPEK